MNNKELHRLADTSAPVTAPSLSLAEYDRLTVKKQRMHSARTTTDLMKLTYCWPLKEEVSVI